MRHESESHFRGRAGLIIEVAPNQFCQFVLTSAEGSVEMDRDVEAIYDVPLSPIYCGPTSVKVNMTGYLADQHDVDRPHWMTEPVAEIGARRGIEGRS